MLVESLCAVLMALKISSAEAETKMPVEHIIFSMKKEFCRLGRGALAPHLPDRAESASLDRFPDGASHGGSYSNTSSHRIEMLS